MLIFIFLLPDNPSIHTVDGAKKFIHCLFYNEDSESESDDEQFKVTEKMNTKSPDVQKFINSLFDDKLDTKVYQGKCFACLVEHSYIV